MKKAAGKPDKTFSKSTEIQGGGESGEEKSKLHKGNRGSINVARNTMGMGAKSSNDKADGAMGKHQSTGDGGASNW